MILDYMIIRTASNLQRFNRYSISECPFLEHLGFSLRIHPKCIPCDSIILISFSLRSRCRLDFSISADGGKTTGTVTVVRGPTFHFGFITRPN